MARTKVTISDIQDDFDNAKKILGKNAKLMPLAEDDGKCVLIQGDRVQTYSCHALKNHLQFVQQQLS